MLKTRYIIHFLLIALIYTQPGGGDWKPVGFVRGTVIDDLTELQKEYASISIISNKSDHVGSRILILDRNYCIFHRITVLRTSERKYIEEYPRYIHENA